MKASCSLFGYNALGLRLPTILALFVFVTAIFELLRKHVGSALAGAAAIVPLFGSAANTEFFARPPVLMMAPFALLCLVWEHDLTPKPKLWRSIAIAALLGFAISMHFYSVLFVPIMVVLELVWTSEHRTLRIRHWIGIVAGACVLLLWVPVIFPIYRATHASAAPLAYYARPSPQHLFLYLQDIAFNTKMIQMLLIVVLIGSAYRWLQVFRGAPGSQPIRDRADNLGAIGFATVLFPLVTYIFALVVTHVFNERYIVSCALGISIALALLARALRWPRALEVLLLLVVLGFYAREAVTTLRHPVDPLPEYQSFLQTVPGTDPIALPNGAAFFASQESSDPAIRARSLYLLLPPGTADTNAESGRIAAAWKTLRPELPVYNIDEYLEHHNSFYLLSWGTPGENLFSWAKANLHTQLVAVDPGGAIYKVTKN